LAAFKVPAGGADGRLTVTLAGAPAPMVVSTGTSCPAVAAYPSRIRVVTSVTGSRKPRQSRPSRRIRVVGSDSDTSSSDTVAGSGPRQEVEAEA
jgi:hypothetical protein